MKSKKLLTINACALLLSTQTFLSASAAHDLTDIARAPSRSVARVSAEDTKGCGCWAWLKSCFKRTGAVVEEVLDTAEDVAAVYCKFVDGVDTNIALIHRINPSLDLSGIERPLGVLRLVRDEIRGASGAVGAIGGFAAALSRGEVKEAIPELLQATAATKALVDSKTGKQSADSLDAIIALARIYNGGHPISVATV